MKKSADTLPPKGKLSSLRYLLSYLKPYRNQTIAAVVALAFTAFMAFLIGFYFMFTAKRVGALPEDDLEADPEDADPEYGFFSPHSWWPLALGASFAIIAYGWVFAAWVVAFGVASLLISLWGFVFEYYRGDHAH